MERVFKRKIIIVFLLAFVLRIAFVLTLKEHFYFDDEFEYYHIVKNFLSGNGLIAGETLKSFRPPLYPLFLSLLYFFNFNLTLIRIIQALISALTIIYIYLLGKKIFEERVGFFSAVISCFYPFFIFYAGFLLTETLFIFLVVISIYYLTCSIAEKKKSNYVKTGIFLGLASLCRPTMELYFPLAIFYLILLRDLPLKEKIIRISLISTFFILTLSPWIVRNYLIFRKFIPGTTMGGWVFWEGNNPKSDGGPCSYFPKGVLKMNEIDRDKFLYKKTIEVIKENPKRFFWLLKNKFIRFWNIIPNAPQFQKPLYRILSICSFGVLLPFFFIGFFISLKNKKAIFIHYLIIFFTLFHMIFLASIRYRVAIEPFYIILAVYGFFSVISPFVNRGGWICPLF